MLRLLRLILPALEGPARITGQRLTPVAVPVIAYCLAAFMALAVASLVTPPRQSAAACAAACAAAAAGKADAPGIAAAPVPSSDGAAISVGATTSSPIELGRIGDDVLLRECGRISEQCSGWIYAGLCRLGKREVQACRYCERDCQTGEKECHRVHRQRCKIAV